MFLIKPHKSCLITYLGIVFGIFSMCFSIKNIGSMDLKYFQYSLIFLMLSGICDMFDGKFARSCKRTEEQKQLGIQLDSLADTFCFLAVPVVLMISLGLNSIIDIIIYSIFCICGVTRLSYFNVVCANDTNLKSYKGLPVTTTAIIYPVVGLLLNILSLDILKIIYLELTFITSILFVLKIDVLKFRGRAYIIVPILALILLVLLLVI
ncbi:MAG: CDP-alcohol phosphatidyltransferase family protein [bacterium]|nr:CDP-alcohol phosphatidyltransferase family protein [bacterium]